MKYVFIIILALQFNVLIAQDYKQVEIRFNHSFSYHDLLKLELLDHQNCELTDSNIVCILSDSEVNYLKKITDVKIVINNIESFYANQLKSNIKYENPGLLNSKYFSFGTYSYFYKLQEIYSEFDKMIKLNPILFTIDTIGFTYEKRPIIAYHISVPDMPPMKKPSILLTALHHAREPGSAMVIIYYLWQLLERIENGDNLAMYLVKNHDITVIPCLNPDGYYFNEIRYPDGGGMWRKNRKPVDTTFGVDLNRNYGPTEFWNFSSGGSSTEPIMDNYRGDSAFSENETKAIFNLFQKKEFDIAMNFHSFGEYLIYPFNYNSSESIDSNFYINFSRYNHKLTDYNFGNTVKTVQYTSRGCSDDWMYWGKESIKTTFAFTPEVGGAKFGFWPTKEQFLPELENCSKMIESAIFATNDFPIIDRIEFDDDKNQILINLQNISIKDLPKGDVFKITSNDSKIEFEKSDFEIPQIKRGESLNLFAKLKYKKEYALADSTMFIVTINNSYRSQIDTFYIRINKALKYYLYNGDSTIQNAQGDSLWCIKYDNTLKMNLLNAGILKAPNNYKIYSNLTFDEQIFDDNIIKLDLKLISKWNIEPNYDFGMIDIFDYKTEKWVNLKTERMGLGTLVNGSTQISDKYGLDGYFPLFETLNANISEYLPKIKLRFTYTADGYSNQNFWQFKEISLNAYDKRNLNVKDNKSVDLEIFTEGNYLEIKSQTFLKDVKIINLLGSELYNYDINSVYFYRELPVLTTGVYFLVIKTDNSQIYRKFLIK